MLNESTITALSGWRAIAFRAALAEFVKPVIENWGRPKTAALYSRLLEQLWSGVEIDVKDALARLQGTQEGQNEIDPHRRDSVVSRTLGVIAEAVDYRRGALGTAFAVASLVADLSFMGLPQGADDSFEQFCAEFVSRLNAATDAQVSELRGMARARSKLVHDALPFVAKYMSWPEEGLSRSSMEVLPKHGDGTYEDL